jgi:hypothetical protein
VTRNPNIVALLAFLMAAGCTDSYPVQVPPLTAFYYPSGIAVRSFPGPASAGGRSELVVVSSNFDLRYDPANGGTVLVVDPDKSGDAEWNEPLAVLGGYRVGSFGGEVEIADATCAPLADGDPAVKAGGAKVVLASRSTQILYRIDMDAQGVLSGNETTATALPVQFIDPYGVTLQCSTRAGLDQAYAFITHLAAPNGLGLLTRLDLVDGIYDPIILGAPPTYHSTFDRVTGKLFISSSFSLGAALRWVDPLLFPATGTGPYTPLVTGRDLTALVAGGLTRDTALSNDGERLYVNFALVDVNAAINTGFIFQQGGGIGVYEIRRDALNQPDLALLSLVPTCLGSGQIKVLPPRTGKRDLVAVTCDAQGILVLYDDQAGNVVSTVGLDPDTGLPKLGLLPFGLATEAIDPSRATPPPDPPDPVYGTSPCGPTSAACDRIYVASFGKSWVNILELDPARPDNVALVKRIGGPP